jgi:hypothetical protein
VQAMSARHLMYGRRRNIAYVGAALIDGLGFRLVNFKASGLKTGVRELDRQGESDITQSDDAYARTLLSNQVSNLVFNHLGFNLSVGFSLRAEIPGGSPSR